MNEPQPYDGTQTGPGDCRAVASWMQEIVPFGIFTTDHELKLTSWNDWLTTHSGLAAEDVLNRRLKDLYPETITPRVEERYARALQGEVSVLSVALHKYLLPFPSTVPESGLPHMLQTVRIAPRPDVNGTMGTITIIEDVTQREFQASILNRQQSLDRLLSEALAKLLQSDDPTNEMPNIFASVRIALGLDSFVSYIVSPDGQSMQLNAAVGVSPKQREAIMTLPLVEGDRAQSYGTPATLGLSIPSHTESLRQFGISGLSTFPLAVGGRVMGLVAFGHYGRTGINAADASVLARIAGYVGIALDRAKREQMTIAASRAKDDFLAALSHELRTPLNPVLLVASDAMNNKNYPPEAREAFNVIEKNALLEARLIDDLLDITRIAHGKLALEMQRLDVLALLREAESTVSSDAIEQGLSVQTALHSDKCEVVGDSGRLRQVFWNILKNAMKFTPTGGRICISSSVDKTANEVAVQISDTGIGMDAAELSKIFGAFSQGKHAIAGRSHRFGGLGLGLHLSRTLVEMHGGRIEATSAGKGQGSTFTIYLPLAVEESPKHSPSRPANDSNEGAETTDSRSPILMKRGILLVEDHEQTRAVLASLLVRRGYQVVVAASAQAALKAAQKSKFTLVLSDIGLPDSDGFTLMRQLRDEYGLKGIALTGYGMEEDMARSSDAGFLAHLTKPINVKILDRTLAEIFQQ